jgi:hypothetical protein
MKKEPGLTGLFSFHDGGGAVQVGDGGRSRRCRDCERVGARYLHSNKRDPR